MSRIWIYQAERKLTSDEMAKAVERGQTFVESWKAHGKQLKASFHIEHDLFVILKVNEQAQEATGCSIDESVHFMKELGNELSVDFFNRTRVAYIKDDQVHVCSPAEFQALFARGEVAENTMVFNNAITNSADLENNWLVPLASSWQKRLVA